MATMEVTLWQVYLPPVFIVAAFVIFARILTKVIAKQNDQGERIANLEGRSQANKGSGADGAE